jgi:cobyrinic acid a,c-diamide synthase
MDARGSYSTAELAKLLQAPVVLVVDCSKATRTVAASVLGCQHLDPDVPIRGVILNQTAGSRHEKVLREAIERVCGVPVVGAVARLADQHFPERHLGLVPPQEHERQAEAIERARAVAEQYLDLDALRTLAEEAPELEFVPGSSMDLGMSNPPSVRIGVFRDAAFQFYYPENLEALVRKGARLIEISPLVETDLPEVDGLYIGGGFPETLAPALAENERFLQSVRRSVESGLPVYAECGGAVFLGDRLLFEGNEYDMAGVLPVIFAFENKPQGHGYTVLETVEDNPFFRVGEAIHGHEFHYTRMQPSKATDLKFAFRVRRGYGFDGERDGLCRFNVLASYAHVHALGTESWAPSIVQAAARFKSRI